MKLKTACNIAIKYMKEERGRRYAFNAKLYTMGVHSFRTEKDKKEYDKITEAIKMLEAIK